MDKSWIDMPRNTTKYLKGLNKFLDLAFENCFVNGKYFVFFSCVLINIFFVLLDLHVSCIKK